jgi:hypothetical protein
MNAVLPISFAGLRPGTTPYDPKPYVEPPQELQPQPAEPPLSPLAGVAVDPAAHVAAIKQAMSDDPIFAELVKDLFAAEMLTGLRDVKIIHAISP